MNIGLSVLFVAAIIAAEAGLGRWRRERGSNPRGSGFVESLLFGGAAVLGMTAYGIAVLGLTGTFSPVVITGMAIGLLFAGVFAATAEAKRYPRKDRSRTIPRRVSGWTVVLSLVIAVLAFLTLTGALSPATSNEWDALAYHLAVPKVWLESGRIHPIPYDHHSNFPFLTEMLFSIGLAWKSVPAAKAIHWLFGMLGALACYWAGREWVSRTAGLLAAAMFLAAPIVVWEATTAYIDLASTVYVALSVFAFIKWLEGRPHAPASSPEPPGEGTLEARADGWLYLAGIMAGFAAGTKMTMVATSGLLVLWVAGCALLRRPGFATWKHAGILAGLALLIGGPWYIKTWLYTGNPVYPFAYNLFGGNWWSAQAAADYAAEQVRFGIGRGAYGLWVAPWATAFFAQYYANPPATFTGILQDAKTAHVFPAVFGSLGLGAIAFVPLWLLMPGLRMRDERPDGNGALGKMVLYSGAFVVVWFALTHQTRYLMVLLPLLLVPGAAGVRAFWRSGPAWRWGTGAVAAITLLWGVVPAWVLAQPAFPVVWGGQTADAYLREREPIYVVSQRINETLPPDAKILLMQEVRGFYLDRDYQWGNPEQNALIPWESLKTPQAMDEVLRAQGITHVLVNWGTLPRNEPRPKWARLAEAAAAKGLWTPVIVMGDDPQRGFTVYKITPDASSDTAN